MQTAIPKQMSLFNHHQPSRHHRAVPRHKSLRRQLAANAGCVSRLSSPGDPQHRQRDRVGHDAAGVDRGAAMDRTGGAPAEGAGQEKKQRG